MQQTHSCLASLSATSDRQSEHLPEVIRWDFIHGRQGGTRPPLVDGERHHQHSPFHKLLSAQPTVSACLSSQRHCLSSRSAEQAGGCQLAEDKRSSQQPCGRPEVTGLLWVRADSGLVPPQCAYGLQVCGQSDAAACHVSMPDALQVQRLRRAGEQPSVQTVCCPSASHQERPTSHAVQMQCR